MDASGTTNLTPATGGGQPWSYERTRRPTTPTPPHRVTIFGASPHGELKTLAIIVDAISDTDQQARDHVHHVWVVVDAAVVFQIVGKLA